MTDRAAFAPLGHAERVRVKVWDPLVRVFHWSLVGLFAANALFTDAEGKLHENIGYLVLGLVGLRLVWGFVGTRHARFADFPPSVSGSFEQLGEMATARRRIHAGHSPLGAMMIYNLLASMIVIGVSGWAMTTTAFWGVGWVESLHETAVGWAELTALVHIAAVLIESLRLGVNLPRAMITGYKEMPDTYRDPRT